MTRPLSLALAASLVVTACGAYDAPCADGDLLGYTIRPLDLREGVLRTQEAAAGNFVADALVQEVVNADLAAIPAYAISEHSACGHRPLVDPGPLYEGDLRAMLANDEPLVVLTVSQAKVKAMLEYGVSKLGDPGPWGESPYFVQVSRNLEALDISCSRRPTIVTWQEGEATEVVGERVGQVNVNLIGAPASFRVVTVASFAELGTQIGWWQEGLEAGDTIRSAVADSIGGSQIDSGPEGRISINKVDCDL